MARIIPGLNSWEATVLMRSLRVLLPTKASNSRLLETKPTRYHSLMTGCKLNRCTGILSPTPATLVFWLVIDG